MVGRLAFAVPGDLATPTGGYGYDRRIIAELRVLGWQVEVIDIGSGFPRPNAEELRRALALLCDVPPGWPIVIDGLAFGVMDEEAGRLARLYPLIALVHHPLALESGLDPADANCLRASERRALAAARHVVVTSAATARLLAADYAVPADRITTVCPGTDPVAAKPSGGEDRFVRLLSVGAVVPRKGFDVLIAALAKLSDLPWTLTIAGDRSRDPTESARLDADILRFRLGDRVAMLGSVPPERMDGLYAGADLFVLASRYEGYGMAIAEAVMHGLPVVTTTAGAIPETVPEGAGVLVPPDDAGALAEALRRLIASPRERQALAGVAVAAARQFPSWPQAAARFGRAIEDVA